MSLCFHNREMSCLNWEGKRILLAAMKKSSICTISSAPSPILASAPAALSINNARWMPVTDSNPVPTICCRYWEGGRACRAKWSRTYDRMSAGVVEGEWRRVREEWRMEGGIVPARVSIKLTVRGAPRRWAPWRRVMARLKSPPHLSIKAPRTRSIPSPSPSPPSPTDPPNLTPSPAAISPSLSTPASTPTGPNRNFAHRLVNGSMIRLT